LSEAIGLPISSGIFICAGDKKAIPFEHYTRNDNTCFAYTAISPGLKPTASLQLAHVGILALRGQSAVLSGSIL